MSARWFLGILGLSCAACVLVCLAALRMFLPRGESSSSVAADAPAPPALAGARDLARSASRALPRRFEEAVTPETASRAARDASADLQAETTPEPPSESAPPASPPAPGSVRAARPTLPAESASAPPPRDEETTRLLALKNRHKYVEYLERELQLTPAQHDVLERLFAERPIVPGHPQVLQGFPELLQTFRTHLTVEQARTFDGLTPKFIQR